MPGINRSQARDAIYTILTTELNTAYVSVLGKPGFIRYSGIKASEAITPPNDIYWSHLSLQTISEDQETLRNNDRRFKTEGLVFVQLFVPNIDAMGGPSLDLLGEAVRNIFRRRAPDDVIEFTRARIVDSIKPEPNWLRANVVSEFQYRQFI